METRAGQGREGARACRQSGIQAGKVQWYTYSNRLTAVYYEGTCLQVTLGSGQEVYGV